MKLLAYLLGHLLLVCTGAAFAQAPEVVLVNGKVVSADERGTIHQALAVRDGRIVAVGSTAKIRALAGKQTRTVDLAGRTVIPGLIDSHMHAIRAALSYSTEVHWFGAASVEEALGRVRDAAKAAKPGALAHRRRRLDRGAVQGGPPPDAGRARRRGAGQSGVRAVDVRLGDAHAARVQGARNS